MADNVVEEQRAAYFPQMTIKRLSGLGMTGTAYKAVRSRTWQYAASLTMLRRRRRIKTGFDWRRFPVSINNIPPLVISASGSFTGGPNPQAAVAASGQGLADLLPGVANVSYNYRANVRRRRALFQRSGIHPHSAVRVRQCQPHAAGRPEPRERELGCPD